MKGRCYIDANVWIALIELNHQFHLQAVSLFESITSQGLEIVASHLVADEVMYIVVKHLQINNNHKQEDFWKVLDGFLGMPGLRLVSGPNTASFIRQTGEYMYKYRLHSRDAFHLNLCVSNRIEYFATLDEDFREVFNSGLVKPVGL